MECKYGKMVCSEWALKEAAKDPLPLMQFRFGVVVMEHRGFTLRFDVGRLPEVLEMLGL